MITIILPASAAEARSRPQATQSMETEKVANGF